MKKCSKCCKEADSKFCPDCGAEMVELEATAEPVSPVETEAKPDNSESAKYTYISPDNDTKENFKSASYDIPEPKKEGVSTKTWFVVLFLIIFWPVGLYLMWSRKKFTKVARIVITVVIGVLFVIGFATTTGDDNDTTSQEPIKATEEAIEATEEATEAVATEPDVPQEYKSALNKAETYSDMMYMSKAGIYDQLTSEYGEQFSAEAAQYAVDNLKADYNKNALEKAKIYQQDMDMSPEAIRDQLTSEYGEQFTQEEADYAIAHLND